MSPLSAHFLYLIAFTFPCASLFAQTEFSAEIVDTQKPDTPTQAKVYFAKDKMRIESQEHNSRGQGVFIMNFFFRTGDVENACSDWLKIERNTGGTCHKVGTETVNGRSAVKYEGTNSSGEPSSVWLDPKLRFPVKWQGKSSAGELRNIQEGTQSASLFEIPAGYTKMDIGNMMQQRSPQH